MENVNHNGQFLASLSGSEHLNVSKTKCLLFTSQRHKERDFILNLNLLGKSISCETSFKYLSVVFDGDSFTVTLPGVTFYSKI